jgi:hypothetical protein
MDHPALLRPLATLVLMAAATVWVVGSHWSSPACPVDVAAAVARAGAAGTPTAEDVRCSAGADDVETTSWLWTVATGGLIVTAVGLFGAAEVSRRRNRAAGA